MDIILSMSSENKRMWLGVILILMGIFYKPGGVIPVSNKLEKPDQEIVDLVKNIRVADSVDSSKLAGVFGALSEKVSETTLNSNLQVQYFLDFVGKKTFGDELKTNGVSKYPDFAPAVAGLIAQVIGGQDEASPLAVEEKNRLARLFYGLSWKLYKSSNDNEYESYKSKATNAIIEYNGGGPKPPGPDEDDCPCEGKGYIIHGDGHRTDCPCISSGGKCNCSKAKSKQEQKGCGCKDGCACEGEECTCPKVPPVAPSKKPGPQCVCVTATTRCGCIKRYGKCSCPLLSSKNKVSSPPIMRGGG